MSRGYRWCFLRHFRAQPGLFVVDVSINCFPGRRLLGCLCLDVALRQSGCLGRPAGIGAGTLGRWGRLRRSRPIVVVSAAGPNIPNPPRGGGGDPPRPRPNPPRGPVGKPPGPRPIPPGKPVGMPPSPPIIPPRGAGIPLPNGPDGKLPDSSADAVAPAGTAGTARFRAPPHPSGPPDVEPGAGTDDRALARRRRARNS